MSRIVLSADRTLTAGHRLLFDAMLAGSQTTMAPPWLFAPLLLPAHQGGFPLGLRRVEAALLRDGYARDEVAMQAPESLRVTAATRVIGISTGEPLGRGMNSNTMTAVVGGTIWPQDHFQALMRRVSLQRGAARLVIGGPGAWQLAGDAEARRRFAIDHVVLGYCEAGIAEDFRAIEAGTAPPVLHGRAPAAETVPVIAGAALCGGVELSRGCGLGCDFCAYASQAMRHLPAAHILDDVRINLAAGQRHLGLLSEDVLRWGGSGIRPEPQALLSLLAEVRQLGPVGLLQPDHANLCSVARWSDDELAALRRLLAGGDGWVWLNVGVEAVDGALLQANGGTAKMAGVPAAEWGAFAAAQTVRLARAGFLPFASLVMGLPGETPAHTAAAERWVAALPDLPIAVFPMRLAPLTEPWQGPSLSRAHWRLMRAAYRRNFRWVPRLYAQQSRSAGVGLGRRLLVQALGLGQVAQWSGLLAWRQWRTA